MEINLAIIAYTTFSTDSRVLKEAKAAADLGYKLDIYTLNDANLPNKSTFNFINSGIKQYKGNTKLNYLISYIRFFMFCFYRLSLSPFTKKYNFIHVHNMPNFLVFSALVPKLLGSKIVLDIHDLMPEIFSVKFRLPLNHVFIKALYFEERFSCRFANEIIATNKFHVDRFRKNKINNKRITEIINVADESVFYPPEKNGFESEKLLLAYPSTLAKRLGIDNLLEAVEILLNKKIDVQLNIYGDGEYREQIIKVIYDKKIENNVKLSNSFLSLESLSKELDGAHIGIIPLPSNVSNDIAMPVKIYEFFAKKICVVASDLPLLKSCFNNSVIFFNSGNSEDLANKIEYLYNNRDVMRDYANKGYDKFSSQTWIYYKSKFQSILSDRK